MVCAASQYIDMRLSTAQIVKLVNDIFRICDKDKNGYIDFDEYCAFCRENPRILQPFTIDVTKLIEYELEERRRILLEDEEHPLTHGVVPAPMTEGGRVGGLKRKVRETYQKFF